MKLIPLEEVEKIFQKYIHLAKKNHHKTITIPMFEVVADDLKKIPTIDHIEEIDKMQKELKKEDENLDTLDDMEMGISTGKSIMLKRIKERLSLTQK